MFGALSTITYRIHAGQKIHDFVLEKQSQARLQFMSDAVDVEVAEPAV